MKTQSTELRTSWLSSPLKLAFSALICTVSACLGAIFAAGGLQDMFLTLKRPALCIPAVALLPVWVALHLIMTLASWRHWQNRDKDNGIAYTCFLLHYLCILFWPFIYFEQMRPVSALVCAAFLWATTSVWILASRKQSRVATIILIPYWLWTIYLMLINLFMIRMNAFALNNITV